MSNRPTIRRNVSFNMEPEVNFYKRRSPHTSKSEPVPGSLPSHPSNATVEAASQLSYNMIVELPSLSITDIPFLPPLPESPMLSSSLSLFRPPPLIIPDFDPPSPTLSWVYSHVDMSPLAYNDNKQDREKEAAIRATAIATAYQQFTGSLTPDDDKTPASVPAKYVSTNP